MNSTGEKLKKLRKQKGLTQKNVADHLGLHSNSISMYEKGNRKISIENIEKLSQLFGVSTDYLISENDITLEGNTDKKEHDMALSDLLDNKFDKLNEALMEDEKYLNLMLKNIAKKIGTTAFEDYESWSIEDKKELLEIIQSKAKKIKCI